MNGIPTVSPHIGQTELIREPNSILSNISIAKSMSTADIQQYIDLMKMYLDDSDKKTKIFAKAAKYCSAIDKCISAFVIIITGGGAVLLPFIHNSSKDKLTSTILGVASLITALSRLLEYGKKCEKYSQCEQEYSNVSASIRRDLIMVNSDPDADPEAMLNTINSVLCTIKRFEANIPCWISD